MTSRRCVLTLAVLALPLASMAQLRVGTWNITNWSTNESSSRVNGLTNAIFLSFQGRSFNPDILMLQEVESATALNQIRDAMNAHPNSTGDWVSGPFINGPDTENVLLFRGSKLQLLANVQVVTGGNSPLPPRNAFRTDFLPTGYSSEAATLSVYNVHFKAGTAGDDQNRRQAEANAIRTDAQNLPAGRNFLIAGDLNVQRNTDAGYDALVGSQSNNAGRFFDPIDSPGVWNNSGTWRYIHTQDPWDGASAGGMDDRFDFILCSANLVDNNAFTYRGNPSIPYSQSTWNDPNHSYRCWGNDGSNYNGPMNVDTNAMVGPTIAGAIRDSLGNQSGHLPVFADFLVPPRGSVSTNVVDLGYVFVGFSKQRTFQVQNVGNTSLWTANGIAPLTYTVARSGSTYFSTPFGPFNEPATAGSNTQTITFTPLAAGRFRATFQVQTNDPEVPNYTVTAVGVGVRTISRR